MFHALLGFGTSASAGGRKPSSGPSCYVREGHGTSPCLLGLEDMHEASLCEQSSIMSGQAGLLQGAHSWIRGGQQEVGSLGP